MGQPHIYLDKELEAGETSATEPGLRHDRPGHGDPDQALFLRERAPTFGHRAEIGAHRALRGGAGVDGDEGWVADLAIAIALPNYLSAFPRFRIGHFHN